MRITEQQIRDDLHRGYIDARRYKRTTLAQMEFEECQEPDLELLANDLVNRCYKPKPAFCFITFDPVQREVFASQFEDRIVQHMLYSYLTGSLSMIRTRAVSGRVRTSGCSGSGIICAR